MRTTWQEWREVIGHCELQIVAIKASTQPFVFGMLKGEYRPLGTYRQLHAWCVYHARECHDEKTQIIDTEIQRRQ